MDGRAKMIKRVQKTDAQLYIDWASADPDWLENMPLTEKNLEAYKKTIDFSMRKINDCFGVIAHEIMDSPVFKALEKFADQMAKTNAIGHKDGNPQNNDLKNIYKKSETCSEE